MIIARVPSGKLPDALVAHLRRVADEDAEERFTPDGVDWDSVAKRYHAGSRRAVGDYGWARVWVATTSGGLVVGHASLVGLPNEMSICNGHISVERPYRGGDLAKRLNIARFAWLDKRRMAITGPVAPGNERSMRGCLRAGFVPTYKCPETGAIWVTRYPSEV